MKSNYTVDGEEWGIYFPPSAEDKTPCDVCEILIDTEIHAEELGMCIDCSNDYFSQE
jgi:hypothetical protein